eukprot:gene5011-5501_t
MKSTSKKKIQPSPTTSSNNNSNTLFPKHGIRLSHFQVFIERCGGYDKLQGKTTAQVCEEYVKPMTTITSFSNNEIKKLSYCEMLKRNIQDRQIAVGIATIFISHAWKFLFLDVVEALRYHLKEERHEHSNHLDDPILWFDLFSNNQHEAPKLDFNWWSSTFKSAIREFGHTILVLSPWQDPIPLTRAWCLFEIYCTADCHCTFSVAMSAQDQQTFLNDIKKGGIAVVKEMMAKVDLARSDSYCLEDKDKIFEVVRRSIGFDALNSIVFSQLRNWMVQTASQAMENIDDKNSEKASYQIILATLRSNQGEFEEAKRLYSICYQNRLEQLGEGHPDTLLVMNKLVTTYRNLGQYQEAEKLGEEAFQRCQKYFGQDHVDTLTAMNTLALIYKDKGRSQEALEMYKTCLAGRTAKLGDSHPSTISTMNNLAMVYKSLNQYQEAEKLYAVCLTKCKTTLGDDHPDTLSAMNNLAIVYRSLGKYDEAIALYYECLTKKKVKLGEDHPETLSTMFNLAKVYRDVGQLDRALVLLEQCLDIRKWKLGVNHPATLATMQTLASVYQEQKKLNLAMPLYEDCLPKMKEKFGKKHNKTITVMTELLAIYKEVGNDEKALAMETELRRAQRAANTKPAVVNKKTEEDDIENDPIPQENTLKANKRIREGNMLFLCVIC